MSTDVMENTLSEHDLVVKTICDANNLHYKVLCNLDKEEYYIAQMFPDIILLDKAGEKPVFIIEVKKNGNIAKCIQQWKSVPSIPATLYVIVPETEETNARAIADVVGLSFRLGTYAINNNQVTIKYG